MAQESKKHEKDETGCQPPEGPFLCANDCGFFGSKATMNMCSKCYRDLVMRRANSASVISLEGRAKVEGESPKQANSSMEQQDVVTVTSSSEFAESSSGPLLELKASPSPARCFFCKKRVGLTGFKCRCGNLFCSTHRYSEKHQCSVDFKALGRDAISKANPVIKAEKLDKM